MTFDYEDSHIAQKIIRMGRDEGLLQGVKDGCEQGQLVWIRRHVELMVSKRFPDLVTSMRAQADQTNNLEKLQKLLLGAATVSTVKDLEQYSLNLSILTEFVMKETVKGIDEDDDGPTFKRLVQKGRDEGLEEGYGIGLQKGYFQAARKGVELVVGSRFPALAVFVRVQIEQISDLKKLDALLLDAGTSTTALEAVQYLLNLT